MDVRLPDGTVVQNVPDGMTQAQLMERLQRYPTPRERRGQQAGEPDASMRGYNPPERNVLSSVAHAGLDSASGVAQIVSRAADAMGLPPGSDYPFVASPDVVERSTADARAKVDKTLGRPNPGGMDLVRGATSAALVTPYMGAVGTAPTMLGRTAQAAKAGAVQGAAQPVEKATDNLDFAKTKAFQGATGALFAAPVQAGMEMGSRGITSLANSAISRVRGAVQDTSEDTAALIAAQTLAQQGVKWSELSEKVRQSIVGDVQEALKKYGGVDPKAIGRQADFKALDIDPLKPWVTRDPVEWGKYKNLEGSTDAGEPLVRARADLDRRLIDRLEKLRGGNAGDAFQAGSSAGSALSRKHEAARAHVTGLYDSFRRTAPNVAADPKRLTDTILDRVEGDALGDFLSPGLRNLVNDMASGKRPMTPDALYRAQQVANAEVRKGGNEGRAARYVVEGIDNELEQMGRDLSAVGPDMANAAELLKRARAAHRSLKTQEEAIPALRDVAEGKFAAEDFFNRYILGGDVKEVAAMWSQAGSQEVKQAARSQIIDYLKKKAAGGGSDDAAVFRQGNFSEALSSPGMPQKIKIILGEKGLAEVQRVQRAAEAAIRTPAGTRYNTSGTAAELMNLARRGSGLPVFGPMVSEPMQKLLAQSQAAGMQKAGPGAIGVGAMDPFYEELLRRMQRGAGLLSPAAGGLMAGELSN